MKDSVCFLGTGKINAKHVRLVKGLFPKLRLSVASRDSDRARDFQKRFNLSAAFGSYAEAVASDFSTLVIGVPPRYHFDWVGEGLKAGKHLLIEKPIFNSLAEFKTVWPALKKHPGVVMVAENQWFDPFHRRLKKILQQGKMGRPLFIDLVRLGVQRREGWRADPKEMPLGALHEGGVHWIRRLLDLAGAVESLRAQGPSLDDVTVTARHASGLTSRLRHSWTAPRKTFRDLSQIRLEKGTIRFEGRGMFGWACGHGRKFLFPALNDPGGFKTMWRHFIDCVEQGKQPALTLEDIFFDFAYLDAAYRSLASGKAEVPEKIPSS